MHSVKSLKKYKYVYIAVLVGFTILSFVLLYEIDSLNSFYSFKQTSPIASGVTVSNSSLCTANKSTMIFFYADNCQSCATELSAFTNVTSKFAISGSAANGTFYSSYFCAYAFNITAYNTNASDVMAPPGSESVFASLAQGKVPFVFIGGAYAQYYKIGGFDSEPTAEQQLLQYACMSINDVAPACQ